MIEKIKDFNLTFIEMYCDLYRYRNMIPAEHLKYMREQLFSEYKKELEYLMLSEDVELDQKLFEIRERREYLIPQYVRRLFWHRPNKIAKLMLEQIESDVDELFRGMKSINKFRVRFEPIGDDSDEAPAEPTTPDEAQEETKTIVTIQTSEETTDTEKKE